LEQRGVRVRGMAHELDNAALLREPLEEIEQRIEVDRAGVLELAHKAVRRAHTGVAKSRALASVVRSRGGPGLLREREQGLFARAARPAPSVSGAFAIIVVAETIPS